MLHNARRVLKYQFLITKNGSRHSVINRALNELKDVASTVGGDSEFQTLTTLNEKKWSLVSRRGVVGFNFQLCPRVTPERSSEKSFSIGVSIRLCKIL
jgi:hypothetical protein